MKSIEAVSRRRFLDLPSVGDPTKQKVLVFFRRNAFDDGSQRPFTANPSRRRKSYLVASAQTTTYHWHFLSTITMIRIEGFRLGAGDIIGPVTQTEQEYSNLEAGHSRYYHSSNSRVFFSCRRMGSRM
jgi:hypothetical protein